jgi:site-specific recombinase XerD
LLEFNTVNSYSKSAHDAGFSKSKIEEHYCSVSDVVVELGQNLFSHLIIIQLLETGKLNGQNIIANHWIVDKNSVNEYARNLLQKASNDKNHTAVVESDEDNSILHEAVSFDSQTSNSHSTSTIISSSDRIIGKVIEIPSRDIISTKCVEENSARIVKNNTLSASCLPEIASHYIDRIDKSNCEKISRISINALGCQAFDEIAKTAKRLVRLDDVNIKGVKLEISNEHICLVVKAKQRGINNRCLLAKLKYDEVSKENINSYLSDYEKVFTKLKRRPNTAEFKLHSQNLETIGDVLHAHLEFNVKSEHGEGSGEWKQITMLIKNHLSKNIAVVMPSGSRETILIMNEKLENMTQARFKSYLRSFAESNGTHDKIVTRIKAAMNFCFNERLLGRDDIFHFHDVKRINSQRHVEFSDKDLKALFVYLDNSEKADFRFFMNLQSTGHFRTMQVMGMKYSQIDFAHSTVKVKAKGGSEIELSIPVDITQMISDRMKRSSSKYLFPSQRAQIGHKANFDKEWTELRIALGFFTELTDGEVKYKYRLHDFRESLLGRLEDLDDLTLSSLLGHLSLYSLKHYRKANKKLVKKATELGYGKLQEVSDC